MELAELAQLAGGPHALFSFKSPSFRKLGLDPKALDDRQLLELMESEPRLIRRPIVRLGNRLVVGFDRSSLRSLVGAGR